jgi:hypothetical protein
MAYSIVFTGKLLRYLQLLIPGLLCVDQSLYYKLRESEIEFDSSLLIALLAVLFANMYVLYENTYLQQGWLQVTAHVIQLMPACVRACEIIIYDIPRKVVN